MSGETYIDRMRKELAELDERIEKAGEFYISNECRKLPFMQRSYLQSQINCMKDYRFYLQKRLKFAENDKNSET